MIKYNSKTIIKAYQNGNLINKIDKVVSGSTPSSRLPSGYTEVEYIENQNNAYINTLFKPNQDTRIVCEMQTVTSTSYGRFIGCGEYVDLNAIQFDYETGANGILHISWGAVAAWTTYSSCVGDYNKHVYDWDKNYFYRDKGESNQFSASTTYTSFQCTDNLGIFNFISNNREGDQPLLGKLYSFKIYDNGTLVRDFIPCTRDSDSKAGVYDIVNDVFYTSANSGYELVAGDPITPSTAVTSESKTIFQYVTDGNEPTPPSFDGKYKFTLTDDSVVSGECDSSSAITTAETSEYTATLKEAVIGDCNTSIGNGGFQNCSGLTSINIPDSVELIDGFAFFRCYSLSSATLGSGVTTIGADAFRYCSGLTSINIPDSVTTIGVDAFHKCTSLPVENNVRYADTYIVGITDRTLTTYTLKNTTRFISEGVFNECYSLENIVIPDSVTSIGYGAFYQCYSLTSCTIGSGVTSISNETFNGCTSLTSITIPDSVTSIGDEAFYGCSGLITIIVRAIVPPELGRNAFANTNNAQILVPSECVNTYKTTSGWSSYADRIQAIP